MSSRTLSPRLAYGLVAAIIGLALFAAGTPSPLYATYRSLWDFSPVVLTLIYATSAFGTLLALVLAGRVSDQSGRRPVLLVSLAALVVTSVLFMLASSVTWLYVARGLQGVATGLVLGAASAAMLDLHPRRDPAGVGLANGVVSSGGLGLGVLVSSVLVQFAPAPHRVLPYVLLLVLFLAAFVGAWFMPEPVLERSRPRLTPQRPSIPPAVRRPFLLASLGVISSWSIGGLFLSLGPSLSATLFQTSNHLVTGLAVFSLAGAGAVAQLAFGRLGPLAGRGLRSLALSSGMVLIVLSAASNSPALFWAGSIIGGGGFGLAFLGALRALSAVIPVEHRAAVMSAFYIVAYTALSVPAILAGSVVNTWGLQSTFEVFGSVIAALALVVAFEAWRTRPPAPRFAVVGA